MVESNGRAYHLRLTADDIGKYVLLPGDPGRCETIAAHFDDAELRATNREYTTYTGEVAGVRVSVTSTGIGCPSTAIAVEELAALGAHTFLRVGTSGAMQEGVAPGDLVVATAAIRDEGTSRQYAPLEFPAVADLTVTQALIRAAEDAGIAHHVGVVHSKDSFYGEVEPERMPIAEDLHRRWEAWRRMGALASEMEAATLFIVAQALRCRAGCLLLAAANVEYERPNGRFIVTEDVDQLARVAVAAVRQLIEQDRADSP
jgi:uridine phosphorylase